MKKTIIYIIGLILLCSFSTATIVFSNTTEYCSVGNEVWRYFNGINAIVNYSTDDVKSSGTSLCSRYTFTYTDGTSSYKNGYGSCPAGTCGIGPGGNTGGVYQSVQYNNSVLTKIVANASLCMWQSNGVNTACSRNDIIYGEFFNFSLSYPTNTTRYNNFNGSINLYTTFNVTCELNDTRFTLNSTEPNNYHNWKNNTVLNDGNISLKINCSYGNPYYFWFFLDTVYPIATTNIINNSIMNNPFNLTVNYSDIYLFRTNTTIIKVTNNNTIYNNYSGNLSYGTSNYDVLYLLNTTNSTFNPGEQLKIRLEAADTHTAGLFSERPVIEYKNNIIQKEKTYKLKFGNFKVTYPIDMDIEEIYIKDRIQFKLKTESKIEELKTKFIEADEIIYYPESKYPCHMIINEHYWYDCDGLKEPKVTKVSSNLYQIDFLMDKEEVTEKSLGGLNEISTEYFITINKNYTGQINIGDNFKPTNSNFSYTSNSNFNVSWLFVNSSCVIVYNATNSSFDGIYCYNLTSLYLDDEVLFYNTTPIGCNAEIHSGGDLITTNYIWLNKTNNSIRSGVTYCEDDILCSVDTFPDSSSRFNDSYKCTINITNDWFWFYNRTTEINSHGIGLCNGYYNRTLINISYYNELTNTKINATGIYELSFYDGFGSFFVNAGINSTNNHTFCTDYNDATVNLLMYGKIVASVPSYITRTFNIPFVNGIDVSNNPYTNMSLYLIEITNSTTITFTWKTTDFQNINGIMVIYRCNADGTKSLIESATIANGIANVNLQLYSSAYSYEVIIGSDSYDESEYNTCHAESTTTRSYLVDVSQINVLPVVGLYLMDCHIYNTSGTTVKMEWDGNDEDASDIEACIVAYREDIYGRVKVYESCVNQSSGSMIRNVAQTGFNYYVMGTLNQNGVTGWCQETVVFSERSDTSTTMGITGVLLAALFIIALALLGAGDNPLVILFSIIGVLVIWLIGIISFNWIIVSSIIIFGIIITVIGRYTLKGAQ